MEKQHRRETSILKGNGWILSLAGLVLLVFGFFGALGGDSRGIGLLAVGLGFTLVGGWAIRHAKNPKRGRRYQSFLQQIDKSAREQGSEPDTGKLPEKDKQDKPV